MKNCPIADTALAEMLGVLGHSSETRDVLASLAPFEIGTQLGEGGFSLVYEARRLGTQDFNFVIKLPTADSGLFTKEATLRHSLESLQYEGDFLSECQGIPHIVQLVLDRSSGPLPFIVVERLGISLESLYGDDRSLSLYESAIVLRDIASALEGLHGIDMSHNDVSPENILLGTQGWTLIDPSTPDTRKDGYYRSGFHGADRDILALGRTFLSVYLGYDEEEDLPEEYCEAIDEHHDFILLLKRMLWTSKQQYRSPTATEVRRAASRLIRTISQREGPLD